MSLRDKAKEQLEQRSEEAFSSKDNTGMWENIFRKDIETPKLWNCGEGDHTVNILIFEAGKNYPTQPPYSHIKPGDVVYFLDIWVHQKVGVNEANVVCPAKNYGNPCPICENVAKLRKEDNSEEMKKLINSIKAKRRTVYNIVCLDSAEEEAKGVQLWEIAHFFMQKHLSTRSKKKKGGGYIHFADPDVGKEVFFNKTKTGKETVEFTGHEFLDRDGYVISDEILAQSKCIDEMINVYPYEVIAKMYFGGAEDVDNRLEEDEDFGDENPTPSRTPSSVAQPEPETETEPQSPPTTRRSAPVESPAEETTKEDEGTSKCPYNKVFGRDANNFPECNKCPQPMWEECNQLKDAYEKETKANPAGTTRRVRG